METNEDNLKTSINLTSKAFEPHSIVFGGAGHPEMIKLNCLTGDIYVKGKLIENDKELVNAMREFLTFHNKDFLNKK